MERSLIHEEVSNNNKNFGVNDRRFRKSLEMDNNYPGPGAYESKDFLWKTIEKKDINKHNNVYTNHKIDLDLINELSKVPKEQIITPGVGTYNPNIISTMEYNIKSKINPYVDEKVGFGIQAKKEIALVPKENNINLGPGRYYKSKKTDTKQNIAPFNQSNKRFNYEKDINRMPGPGSYDINSLVDWNKKSHNILFV